jgi:hypothetical protein
MRLRFAIMKLCHPVGLRKRFRTDSQHHDVHIGTELPERPFEM